ncbi:MAG: hypothetical protein HGA25_03195 [Clostridiales bacterium]|nr:hypothetical protein [Clostridiales bacterium]
MEQTFKVSTKYVINEETILRDYMFLQLIQTLQHGHINIIKKNDVVYVNPFGFNKFTKYSTVGKFVVTDVKPQKYTGSILILSNGVLFVTLNEGFVWREEDIVTIVMKHKFHKPEQFMELRNHLKESDVQIPLVDYVPHTEITEDNLFNAIEFATNVTNKHLKVNDTVYYNSSMFLDSRGIFEVVSVKDRYCENPLITFTGNGEEKTADSSFLWTRQEIIDRLNVIS